jgi:hypothetical protein
MATTKKLTPVKRTAKTSAPADEQPVGKSESSDLILEELKKQTEYLHRMDWKLWMLMNMVQIIGEENGYSFKFYSDQDNSMKFKEQNDE